MVCTSASGIACAAPTAGSGRSIALRLAALLALGATLPGAAPASGSVELDVTGLRSTKGLIRICLTADPGNFPACIDDKRAITRSVPAAERTIHIDGLVPGTYAAALIHDENSNAKLDTFAGIPREGFGFSRNPRITFGPPRFSAAEFAVTGVAQKQQVTMRYML